MYAIPQTDKFIKVLPDYQNQEFYQVAKEYIDSHHLDGDSCWQVFQMLNEK